MRHETPLGWAGVARLGVAQMALGALTALATSTINRIMVVELALPAIIPGLLVGLHYALQVLRPGWGFASDRASRRTFWIVSGMAVLAGGVVAASAAAALYARQPVIAGVLAVAGYGAIGLGVGAAGTGLLTLLGRGVAPQRRAAAATIVWLMMILGTVLTAGLAGHFLQPFGFPRLLRFVAAVAAVSVGATGIALFRLPGVEAAAPPSPASVSFRATLRGLWADAATRRFALFIFASMLAYSGQELILEPFAGLVFNLPPAGTARLLGLQQAGVMAGMLLVGVAGGMRRTPLRVWTIFGCVGSAAMLLLLAALGAGAPGPWLKPCLFGLGLANGAFAVAAIGAMMQVAGGRPQGAGTGTSMGLFGAAQAVAFGCGGIVSSGASDIARHLLGSPISAYALVFSAEAALFLFAATLASRIFTAGRRLPDLQPLGSPT